MITVADATTQLQQRYISSRFSSSVDEWPPYQPKHYTTLAFIHNKGKFTDAVRFFVAQELAVAGNIIATKLSSHSNLSANMTRNISDIFLPVRASDVDLHILIEGAPGIGKTVLAKEIAYRWAGNELLTSKKLLFLVFLRECFQKPVMTIESLIQFVFKSSEITSCLTKYLTKTQGKDTVIIFDGFDELSEENKKESIIVDIINRRILTKCCLVVTSRPTASSILHECVDRRVEIVGFTEEDRLDYIQTALRTHDKEVNGEQVNNKHVKALQHYLQSNPTINALCYIPLNMTILLCLVEDGIDNLPKTQTKMYKKFIEMTIVRFIKKYDKTTTIIDIAKLLDPYNKLFVELAKLAYKALKTDKIVFTLPEIEEGCPNLTMTSSNWNGLGLLKAVQCFSVQMGNDQVTFHFLHFSIQEYMAAWYISTLPGRKQIKLLQKTFWKHRYYNTWIMYVGITGGCTFSLRHFLSGNWFQLYSKLFRSSKVSDKFLKDKMKCLHLFQCLLEANKEDIIEPVKQLFQNKRIDLSNQTLLPSDLNTLGFFLIRSINRQWDELDLSSCNIGSNGTNILCDRLLDKDARGIVTIKVVKFSYNQLNFTSLIRLFDLFSSWHTSEIVITDDVTQDVKAIEDIILQSSSTLRLVLIGSYLFCKSTGSSRILGVPLNTTNIRSIYLLNCSWMSNDSETIELLSMLKNQKLNKIRIIGSSLDKTFIITLASRLLCNYNSVNMFVYDPTMPDEIADDIAVSSLITSSVKDTSGVMLIVSSSKVQGIVNTCSLSNELSTLEIFNLSIYVRYLNNKMCPWREYLESNSLNKEIIFTFIKLLHKINFNWKLEIILRENNTVIVHKAKLKIFDIFNHFTNNKLVIYLSYCDIQYDVINETCSTLHILNSPECTELLNAKLLHKQSVPNELFIYGNLNYNLMNSLIELLSHDHLNISAVLAANGVIAGIYPSSELIALAFQLQPSPTTWILSTVDNRNIFYQVLNTIAITPTEWVELDFTGCDISDVDCEVVQRTFTYNNCSSTVRKLNISFNRLSVSGMRDLARIVLITKVQELIVNGTNDVLLDCLIKNLMRECQTSYFLSITYNHKILIMVCNTSWNEVAIEMNTQASEMYIINCDLSSVIFDYLHKAHNLLRLCIINGSVSVAVIFEIFEFFSKETIEISISSISIKIGEVSISNARIIDDDDRIKYLVTQRKYYLGIKSSFMLSTSKWLCVYNITNYQLPLIQQYFINQAHSNCYGMSLVRKIEQINGDKMYVFDNSLLNVIRIYAKLPQAPGATQIIAAISNIVSLHTIEIDNYIITNETVDDLANILHHNTQLQELYWNGNCLQADDIIAKILHSISTASVCKNHITDDATSNFVATQTSTTSETNLEIADSTTTIKTMSLHSIATLTKFSISNNNITDKAACHISGVIFNNTYLQELNLVCNDLQASGIIRVAGCLQKISSLTTLHINHNIITHKAADHIAAAISCNTKLQEIDISGNDLHTTDVRNIMKALQGIHTLKMLFLGNNVISCEAADDIAAVISCNTKLQEIDISENNLQTAGVRIIMKALQGIHTLKMLYLRNNVISCEAADDIAAVISCNTKLQEIDISENNLQTAGVRIIMKALQGIHTLKMLYLRNNVISCVAADDIAAAISCNTKLQEIDISDNNLRTIGIRKIMKAVQEIHTLKKLCLSHNDITDEAENDIVKAISHNIHLQEFRISGNKLSTVGAIKIVKALQSAFNLRALYISDNEIDSMAAKHIASVVGHANQLHELDISKNEFQARDIEIILKPLQDCDKLTKLYINDNSVTDDTITHIIGTVISSNTAGIRKIMIALQGIHTLKKLCLSHNNITDEVGDDIAAAISCNTKLQGIHISEINLDKALIKKIMEALQGIDTLRRLCLSHINISDEEAYDIAIVVSLNSSLEEINISRNNLQTRGVKIIVKALSKIDTLIILNLSNNSVTNKAADDIAAAISCNTKLQEIDISENNLQTAGVRIIMKALQGIHTLKMLYLRNNVISCKAADDIAAVIYCNTKLQEIDISENNLQTVGVRIIMKALQGIHTLKMLYLRNNVISCEAADDIAAVIYCNNKLQEIDISENNLQTAGVRIIMKALQGIHTLKMLYLRNNVISCEAADDIAAVISCNTKLQEIDISENNLQTAGVRIIMKALQGIHTLKMLYLGNNVISCEAADDIAAVIYCNTKLQEIDISENNLQTAGVRIIMKALQGIHTLKMLYLRNNVISCEAADDIAAVISCNTKLQEIDISENNLQTAGVRIIMKALQGIHTLKMLYLRNNVISCVAADDIAAAISCNTKLQEIDISENKLHIIGIGKIMKAVQEIHTLKKLCLSHNNITYKAGKDIAKAISHNIHLQEFRISGNKLSTVGAIKIVKALQSAFNLRALYISDNEIDSMAAKHIASIVGHANRLHELDISKNEFQARDIEIILKPLQDCDKLTKLYINDNSVTDYTITHIIGTVISSNTAGIRKIMIALQGIHTLKKLCLSHNNITDEAGDDIAAAISCNTKLRGIHISEINLDKALIKKIMKALQGIDTLRRLCLSHINISDEEANDIATVVSLNSSLEEINISRNNLQTRGVKIIVKALSKIDTLIILNLSNNSVTYKAADDIAAAISCNTKLQEIDISDNNLHTIGIGKIMKAVQEIYTLKKLCLSHNNITYEAGKDIAKAISHNIHLQEFRISGNKLSTVGAIKIVKALQSAFNLRALYISDNEIDSMAAKHIASVVGHANQLHELDISKNEFRSRGIEIILTPLQNYDKLTKLYINDNSVTDDIITHIIGTVISSNTRLREIDISGNNLQVKGAINIAVALQSIVMLTKLCISNNNMTCQAANDIAVVITHNAHLQDLDIGGNDLLAAGATIIAESLQKISTLRKLYINNNKITSEAVDDIAAAVSCNPHLEEFDISKNEIEGSGAIKLAKSFQQISTLKKLFVDHNMITDEAAGDFAYAISHNPHLIAFKMNGNLLQKIKILKDACSTNRDLTEIDI